MKIVIIGAGSVAFTPALLSGFSADPRYHGATIGLVDTDPEVLSLVTRFAHRITDELGLNWKIEDSTDRRDVLPGSDIVTASVGVGKLDAWVLDVGIPYKHGYIQPVGDTSGPGGLGRALRHIPVLVGIGKDMEELCPQGILYNFTNPLTVLTQAVNKLTNTKCVGLCIGPDLTWNHLCRVIGVEKSRTSAVLGGINHCHWMLDFKLDGQDAFPVFSAALDELNGNPSEMEKFRTRYEIKRPQEPNGDQPLCTALYRTLGYYPGPGDGHVAEFFPQLIHSTIKDLDVFQGEAIEHVKQTYPILTRKMEDIASGKSPIETESFAREMAWEHTQLLDILVAQFDDLGQIQYVNVPNRGYIPNLPEDVVVEVPARVDAKGIHPIPTGNLPESILPYLQHKVSSLNLIIEAAMEGSRRKAAQALINDPYTSDISEAVKTTNELIDVELKYLPRFN